MDIRKTENETDLQYHKRIIFGKLEDKTLADIDYAELSELAYGQKYSSDVARRMFYGSKRTLDLIDASNIATGSAGSVMSDIDAQIVELRKERQKFYDERSAYNKVIRDRSRQEELNDILAKSIMDGNLPRLDYTPSYIEASDNDLLVSLNDIHYGMVVNNAWTNYNPDICRQMMRNYLDKIIQIAMTHKSENCVVYNNGDSISGKIHLTIQIANKENVINQVKGVSELISEFLAELSKHFKSVRYVSVAGNHSRIDTKENAPIDERLDDLIEWYLEARLQGFDNIYFGDYDKFDSTMYVVDVRGQNYAGVHGDFDGTDAKVQAVQTMAGRPLYAVLFGHKHHNRIDEVQGIKTVMAGSFLGMDDFCIQKRIFGKPSQLVCVCDENGIRCSYDIPLN